MITAAPGGGADTVFNAPPGWLTPAGFDPRRAEGLVRMVNEIRWGLTLLEFLAAGEIESG